MSPAKRDKEEEAVRWIALFVTLMLTVPAAGASDDDCDDDDDRGQTTCGVGAVR